MQNEGKEKGRDLYQKTHDGTTSAGSMGTGATGHVGTKEGYDEAAHSGGNQQSGGRTDDLLSDGSDAQLDDRGFASGNRTGDLQTGMGDMGSLSRGGNRQQESDAQPGGLGGAMRPSDPDGLQNQGGGAGNMGSVNVPESGGQRIEDGSSGDLIGHGNASGGAQQNRQSGEQGHGSPSGAGSTAADQRDLHNKK
ncbi:hypothetical protein [Pseudoduganella chitinolytica]|uniref:Uncharacterized protein n=1 Tax=Pseudoduganella chitinolytica TaxID=34070 RepID=A0ABY8BIQ7_9BURK|nr:hypothetical protein [Pseudoduganella chitinolytica]WEF35780.1 hypothetical protein PX653_13850 [Pseudoduganella chitinolytica]